MAARFKKAEAAWTHEKAQLRNETEVQRKKSSKLQLEYDKLQVPWTEAWCSSWQPHIVRLCIVSWLSLQTSHRHQTSELKSVMAALGDRDEQLANIRRQLKDVCQNQETDKQSLIDMIAGLKGAPMLPGLFC